MAGYWELRGDAQVWPGVVNRGYVTDFEFQEGSFLADYAKAGKWAKVLEMLRPENHLVNVNQCWPGDGSRSTVLHRAAELDAPEHVVAALLERGALRSLRNAQGHTAHEIASEAGQPACTADALRPVPSP
ncbi:MAG: ankryin, partial [Mycobacterium sp.]|nr:ankryin [Mycobacterium sp.]